MTLWRYKAIPIGSSTGMASGELAGDCPSDVRAALRRLGLQVIELRPARPSYPAKRIFFIPSGVRNIWFMHVRARRVSRRAELYDSLATMLESGMPLLEILDTIIASTNRGNSGWRSLLTEIREQLRSGASLSDAMSDHYQWFNRSEVAMVNAGQHGGTLPVVLRNLAERHERSGELSGKLASALAYPAVVSVVGIGVVVFLSVKTLPDLTAILVNAKIQIPPLTAAVMRFGQFIASFWFFIVFGAFATTVGTTALLRKMLGGKRWASRLCPRVLRRLAVARFAQQLADLKRCGVPIVEALRVIAPTSASASFIVNGLGFRSVIENAADRVERGEELSEALDDESWFDPEFKRLLDIGQATGELDQLLIKISERYGRQARRLIDRLAAMLEPTVLLILATLVGVVVMAAILPLLRLKEIL